MDPESPNFLFFAEKNRGNMCPGQRVGNPQGCIEGATRQSRPGPSGPAFAKNMPKGIFFGRFGPFDCNPQAATCASPRSNSMLLPLSICGRKISISGQSCPEMPFYSKLMFPSKDCLQAFDGRASTLPML